MTESSRDDRLSESARVVKARKERICEVAPEHWEKSASREPNGYSRYRARCREADAFGASQRVPFGAEDRWDRVYTPYHPLVMR